MTQHTLGPWQVVIRKDTAMTYSVIGPCPKCGTNGERFTDGADVAVFDRNVSRTWRPATIQRDEPYHASRHGHITNGAYIRWRDTTESFQSAGGWVPARDIGPVMNSHFAPCSPRSSGRSRR